MTLGYRSLLFASASDGTATTQVAEKCFREWVAGKSLDETLIEDGQTRLSTNAQAMRVSHLAPDGARTLRLRLVEQTATGQWVTTLTATDPIGTEMASWYWLDVDHTGGDTAPFGVGWTAAPRLSGDLLARFDATDGAVRLGGAPIVVEAGQVSQLVDSILSSERRSPILVAACPRGVRSTAWASAVSKFTRETRGLAATFSLRPEETDELNRLLGRDFGVVEGTVRTFLPLPRLGSRADARRHRYLTTARILEAIDRPNPVARALGWGVRIATLNQPLPVWARQVDRRLTELEPSVRLRAIEQNAATSEPAAPAAETSAETIQRGLIEPLFRASGLIEISEEGVGRVLQLIRQGADLEEAQRQMTSQIALMQDRFEEQGSQLEQLRSVKEDVEIDLAQSTEDSLRDQDVIRSLRIALAKAGDSESAWGGLDDSDLTASPADFSELVDWVRSRLTFIEFTGDEAVTLDLETYDALNQWPSIVWSHLLALEDYARVRSEGTFTGSFYDFLGNVPVGCRAMPRGKYSAQESDSVANNTTMKKLRTFTVPKDVEESGMAFMAAHTKIASFATISPRMHFLDDVSSSGRVYVGYIGRHLKTPATN